MAHCIPPRVVRRLCDSEWFKAEFLDNVTAATNNDLAVFSNQCKSVGQASKHECAQLISSSFRPFIKKVLPFPAGAYNSGAAECGGCWFWETYRHALFGENVLVHLGGSGISLAEDTLDAQVELRLRVCPKDTLASPSLHRTKVLLHGSAKLEVVYALALSVALHVAKQPLLEHGEGPQALVLCATKDQCEELACALNHFCASLHLIVHNLFEPYPPMPADKRAEVVIATPPLWESLAKFGQYPDHARVNTASQNEGLEDLLLKVEGEDQLPPTYDLTRWRPYSLAHVAQLVVFDVELQMNMGFGGLLKHILRLQHEPSSVRRKSESSSAAGKLPLSCQLYAVAGGDRFVVETDAVHSLFEAVRSSGRLRFNHGTAELSLACPSPLVGSHEDAGAPLSHGVRKRQRTEDGPRDHSGEESPCKANPTASPYRNGAAFEGILIRSALSHARLLADFTAFTDFVDRVVEEASAFWESFESGVWDDGASHGTPAPASSPLTTSNSNVMDGDRFLISAAPASFLQYARVDLALLCASSANPDSQSCVAAWEIYRAQEVGVWVHPAPSSPANLSSRLALLFQHLNDRLNGELFDGSVVQCVLASDAARLPFTLSPIPGSTTDGEDIRLVQEHELFRYGPNLMPPTLLSIARKGRDEAAAATAARNAERLETLAVVEKLAAVTKGAEASPGYVPRCCFLSTFPRAGQVASSSFSSTVAPSDVSTVIVVRHVAASRVALCGGETSTGSQVHPPGEVKPLALYLLEECCQYGRVLSYYAHEATSAIEGTVGGGQEGGGGDVEGVAAQRETAAKREQPLATGVQSTTASLFIEFASADAAVEAVRLLSRRFALQHQQLQSQGAPARLPRARLFTNRTYYEGVLQELSSHTFGDQSVDDDDSRFGDFHISLLSE
ncbi:hypothetical protein GH5_08080 [Leishmania sp. Ghana 2012 LV757]|uniref:hypothetical protein n=1 Tax=Leishmania sp. Ghana 2012 LV757 TaxID=2803181 RepID=UPI001B4CB2EE|nr:hypothetical protein GH5_08080 [Leishmania sp. Ghana 2012 LV757]